MPSATTRCTGVPSAAPSFASFLAFQEIWVVAVADEQLVARQDQLVGCEHDAPTFLVKPPVNIGGVAVVEEQRNAASDSTVPLVPFVTVVAHDALDITVRDHDDVSPLHQRAWTDSPASENASSPAWSFIDVDH